VLSYLDFLNYRKIEAGLRNTYKVLKTNQELINLVTDAETGQRGYLLTKASRYLEPYRTAIKRLDPEIKQLQQLTADNPSQQQRVDALKPLLVAKLAELQQTIDLRSTSLEAALQVVNTDRGQQLMQQIRKLSDEIAITENQLSQS
jgi:CHASE3 domain sensor protein